MPLRSRTVVVAELALQFSQHHSSIAAETFSPYLSKSSMFFEETGSKILRSGKPPTRSA
jgi:hypothetical protein